MQRLVLYHYRRTVAAIEIAKSYLLSLQLAESLMHNTNDLAEMIVIRRDVLFNPKKYAQALEKPQEPVKDRFSLKETTNREWEHWLRVLNGGHVPVDDLKHY